MADVEDERKGMRGGVAKAVPSCSRAAGHLYTLDQHSSLTLLYHADGVPERQPATSGSGPSALSFPRITY